MTNKTIVYFISYLEKFSLLTIKKLTYLFKIENLNMSNEIKLFIQLIHTFNLYSCFYQILPL